MTTFYDVPAGLLLPEVASTLSSDHSIELPEWAVSVKTGIHRENPPVSPEWWQTRAAAILRKVAMNGPIGVNHLAQSYGGKVDRGAQPNRAKSGSRKIVRSILQQLEDAGLVEKVLHRIIEDAEGEKMDLYKGRKVTGAGHKILDSAARSVKESADTSFPGLNKY